MRFRKVAALNVWDSNHEACEIVNVPIFKHLLAKRLVSFLFRVIRSESHCELPFRCYLRNMSAIYKSIAHFSCRSMQYQIHLRVLLVLYSPRLIMYSVMSLGDVEFFIWYFYLHCVSTCIMFSRNKDNNIK